MRVIAGSAKRMPLKTLPGLQTRPTTDMIKETLFNMISPYLSDCRFLDLFSGSGGIGIEALSRGAATAFFVEKNPKAVGYIQENLKFTKLDDRAIVLKSDVIAALERLEGETAFDYIFMDPPYDQLLEKKVLTYLSDSALADEDTVIIVEASAGTEFSYLSDMGFEIIKEKKYKTNQHIFLQKKIQEEGS